MKLASSRIDNNQESKVFTTGGAHCTECAYISENLTFLSLGRANLFPFSPFVWFEFVGLLDYALWTTRTGILLDSVKIGLENLMIYIQSLITKFYFR